MLEEALVDRVVGRTKGNRGARAARDSFGWKITSSQIGLPEGRAEGVCSDDEARALVDVGRGEDTIGRDFRSGRGCVIGTRLHLSLTGASASTGGISSSNIGGSKSNFPSIARASLISPVRLSDASPKGSAD